MPLADLADISVPFWVAVAFWCLLILFMALAYYHACQVIHLRALLEEEDDAEPRSPEDRPRLKPQSLNRILSL